MAEASDTSAESTDRPTTGSDSDDSEQTKRRIRTLAIFFLGIGVYALVGAGLDFSSLLIENLTTYFVSGGVVLAVGLVLLVLAR